MRDERLFEEKASLIIGGSTDSLITRTASERDRDRVLYSSAFRRLAGVTQVVHSQEGDVYHNRLTHTLEVAQIGRRMAQYLLKYGDSTGVDLRPHLDPDVVEAACLIHDLGHPPFGHIAEHKLDELVIHTGDSDGYEGNAQSFRLVTRLINYSDYPGLNLSRATLNAVLKYPWHRSRLSGTKEYRKYGAFEDDKTAFDFARVGFPAKRRSLEAEVMDLADGIAYAVHDLNDFFKAGILDLSFLVNKRGFEEYYNEFEGSRPEAAQCRDYIFDIVESSLPGGHYSGSRREELIQASNASSLIAKLIKGSIRVRYIDSLPALNPEPRVETTIEFLKSIIWKFVILRPNLALQQAGQEKIVRTVFEFYRENLFSRDGLKYLPLTFHTEENLQILLDKSDFQKLARLLADIVSSMSEVHIKRIYSKIIGIDTGAITDIV